MGDHALTTSLLKKEESTRHTLAMFLTLFTIVAMDTTFAEDEGRKKRAVAWTIWGISFTLLGFNVIGPELEAISASKFQASHRLIASNFHMQYQ